MERTNPRTERISTNPLEPWSSLNILNLNKDSQEDNQANSSASLLQLAMKRLGTFASSPTAEPQHSVENNHNYPFTSDSSAEVQNLTQHLLSLAANSVTHGFVSNLPPVESETNGKWNQFSQVPVSPNRISPNFSNEPVTPVSASPEGTSALTHLASLSQAWSAASPTAVTAFQNALAQLALLGLSSPPPVSNRDFPDIEMVGTDSSSNDKATDLRSRLSPSTIQRMDNMRQLQNGKKYQAAATDECQNQETDTVSKVIIRQTADADEHFFKALRKLKVDVSSDFQPGDLSMTSWIVPSKGESKNTTDNTNSSRTAAEMAVDEHFEKSLAGFRGLNKFKPNNLQLRKPHSPELKQATENGMETSLMITSNNTGSNDPLNNCGFRSRSLIRRHSHQESIPCDSRLCKNNSSLPYTNSRDKNFTESKNNCPLLHVKTELTAGHSDEVQLNDRRTSPGPTDDAYFGHRSVTSSTSSAPASAAQQNSFKPKKNWLAQYDWSGNQEGDLTMSSTSPNISQNFTFDPHSCPQWINLSRAESLSDCTVFEKIHHSGKSLIKDAVADEDPQHFCQKVFSVKPVNGSSTHSGQLSNELSEGQRTSLFVCGEVADQNTALLTDAETSFTRFEIQNRLTGFDQITENDGQFIGSSYVTHKDSATSPIACDHEAFTRWDPSNSARKNSKEHTSDTSQPSTGITISASLPYSCRSSSSSPPAVDNVSGTPAITSISGTTSGFLSASTYSLDSSVGNTHLSALESRDVDSGIDVKSTSSVVDEQSLSDSKHQTSENFRSDNNDSSTGIWSLRKRASSEVSPWSTLKRSRSVLTSPLSCNETHPSYSSTSHELLSQAEEESSSPDDRQGLLDDLSPNSTVEANRSRLPEISRSVTKTLGRSPDFTLTNTHYRQSVECPMPRLYDMYNRPCEQKASSEPSTLTSSPGSIKFFRSHADTSGLLRLKSDSKLFILR